MIKDRGEQSDLHLVKEPEQLIGGGVVGQDIYFVDVVWIYYKCPC
mgnify:CR=1 FL=1